MSRHAPYRERPSKAGIPLSFLPHEYNFWKSASLRQFQFELSHTVGRVIKYIPPVPQTVSRTVDVSGLSSIFGNYK